MNQGQTTAPTAPTDAAQSNDDGDVNFSEFINWPDETDERDASMTDQPSNTGFIGKCSPHLLRPSTQNRRTRLTQRVTDAAQNAADEFDKNASTWFDEPMDTMPKSFFEDAMYGMPEPGDFSEHYCSQDDEYTGSQDMVPVITQESTAANAQIPNEHAELRHLLTATSGPVPDHLEPGAGASQPIDLTAETPRQGASPQASGAQLPAAPIAEMPGQGNNTGTAATPGALPASRAQDAFPKLDRSITECQSGMPLLAPQGCSDAARSGWDYRGWWYQGKHDSCPIPTAHRHDRDGQVSFNGLSEVLELVAKVMVRK